MYIYIVIVALHFNILLVFPLAITSTLSLSTLFYSISLSLSTTDQSIHLPPQPIHHHHNIIIHNNLTSKSTKLKSNTNTPKETESIVANLWLWVDAWRPTGTCLVAYKGGRCLWVDWNEFLTFYAWHYLWRWMLMEAWGLIKRRGDLTVRES